MSKKNKLVACGISIAFCALVVLFRHQYWHNTSPGDNGDLLRIGIINPVTGPLSEYGKKMMYAMKMAASEINEKNGIRIELVFEDAKSLPKDTVNAFQKIKNSNVDALIVTGDLSVSTLQDMINGFAKPTLAVASAKDIPSASKWLFRCSLPVTLGAETLSKFIGKRNVKSVGMMRINCQTGADASSVFRATCEKNGVKVIGEEIYDMNQLDSKSQIAKIIEYNPESIYVFGFGPGYVSALNSLREQKYSGIIVSHYEITSEQQSLIDHGAHVFYSDIDFGEGCSNALALAYCSQYRRRFGVDSDALSAFTYEAVRILYNAYSVAKSHNPNDIRNALQRVDDYRSVVGSISYSVDGEIGLSMFIKEKMYSGSDLVENQ